MLMLLLLACEGPLSVDGNKELHDCNHHAKLCSHCPDRHPEARCGVPSRQIVNGIDLKH